MKYHTTTAYRNQDEFDRVLRIALSKSSSLLIVCPGYKDSLDVALFSFFKEGAKLLKKDSLQYLFDGRVIEIYLEYGNKSKFKSGNAFLPWVSPVAAYEVIQNDNRVIDTFFIPGSDAEIVPKGGKDDLKGYLGHYPKSIKI